VTSKLQVTVPKAVADRYGIKPGDELEWVAAGDSVRVIPTKRVTRSADADQRRRLALFDQATVRQQKRDAAANRAPARKRGWRREDLYERGGAG
jgi:AbrB family looped-hinge helix DNA binding protein